MGSFAWDPSLQYSALELSLENFRLGTFAWELYLENFRLGTFAWDRWLGHSFFGCMTWEDSPLNILRVVTFTWDTPGNLTWEFRDFDVGDFSFATLGQQLQLSGLGLATSVSQLLLCKFSLENLAWQF